MIKKLWRNYITSGILEQMDYQHSIRYIVVNCFTIASCSFLLLFSIVHFLFSETFIGIYQLVFFIIALLNVVFLRIHKNPSLSSSIILIYMIFILLELYMNGGIGGIGYLWYFTYPPLAFFLKGKKKGIIWLLILSIATLFICMLQKFGLLIKNTSYTFFQSLIILICFYGVSGLIYFYEHVKNKFLKLLNFSYQENIKAKIFEEQFLIAEKIQKSLIPEKDLILNEISITGYYKPASNVGGDYFDYFMLDKNNIGIILSDVSGKGIPACISMVNLRSAFKTLIRNKFYSPKDIIRKLNNIFIEEFSDGIFATFFYIIYNKKSKKITFCNAGHGPFVYYSKNENNIKECFVQSLPIGISLENNDYKNKNIRLHSKDIFIIYSDGISEAKNKNNVDYGKQRFLNLIKRNCNSTIADLKKIIINDLNSYMENCEQQDDISFIIGKIN